MKKFHPGVLDINIISEIEKITKSIKNQVVELLKRRGVVVAVSGGIDSSLTVALAVRSLGKDRVLALCLPEFESNPESFRLGMDLINQLDIQVIVEDISKILEAFGCYKRRDDAVQRIFPEYNRNYKFKIVLPQNLLETGRMNVYNIVIEAPNGKQESKRLPRKEFLEIVAAMNHKQRTRTQCAYYHADRLGYAVCGTSNRLEMDQGFFVKGGDGLADIKPIAHLYKSQIYAMARHLGIPSQILNREPTPDTYTLGSTSEEFYFSLPYRKLDLILWAFNHSVSSSEVAEVLGYTEEQINRVYADIVQKRRATYYLHPTLYIESIPEIGILCSA